MRGFVAIVAVVGCYAPSPPTGAPCTSTAQCPGDLVCSPATSTCEHTATNPDDAPLDDAPLDDAPVIDAPIDAPPSTYAYRRRITIKNNTASALPAGYTIRVPLPMLPFLVSNQKVRFDSADLRVIPDSPMTERDRIVDGIGAPAPPALSFSLAAAIPANGTNTAYAIYYGRPNAPAAPANGTSVFPLYDSFSTGIGSAWTANDAPTTAGGNLVLRANHTDALVTNATTDNIPATSAVELVAKVVDPQSDPTPQGTDTFYYWFGYQRTGDFTATDPWVIWVARSKAAIHAEQLSPVGCEGGCGGADATQNNAAHYYTIERDPTTTRFYRDGTLSYSISVMNTVDYAIILRNFMATSDLQIDFVRARARVTPEPTITLGTEEAL